MDRKKIFNFFGEQLFLRAESHLKERYFVPLTAAHKTELKELVQGAILLLEAFQNELSHDHETSEQELRLFLYSLHLLTSLSPVLDFEKQIHCIRHETEQNHAQFEKRAKATKIVHYLRQLHLYLQQYLLDFEISKDAYIIDREKMKAPATILQQLLSLKGLTQKVV